MFYGKNSRKVFAYTKRPSVISKNKTEECWNQRIIRRGSRARSFKRQRIIRQWRLRMKHSIHLIEMTVPNLLQIKNITCSIICARMKQSTNGPLILNIETYEHSVSIEYHLLFFTEWFSDKFLLSKMLINIPIVFTIAIF